MVQLATWGLILRVIFVGLLAITTLFATQVEAYCSEPNPPSRSSKPDKPEPPDRPYCATTRSCSQWEVDSYKSEVEEYNDDLEQYQSDVEDYVRKLKAYVNEAVEYAQCEVRDLDQ